MIQSTLQWNDAVVHDLLHYPQRLLQHQAWSAVIAEAGGLQQMRQQLLDFPLKAKERRVLEVILNNPEDSVVRYTDLLAIHHATFHRQQNALCRSLSHFLNTNQVPAELQAVSTPVVNPASFALPWTSFIGRQTELTILQTLLASEMRWITLVGTGGVGKTRLAMELAQRSIGVRCDQVHMLRFADLQQVEDVGLACIQQLQLVLTEAQSVEQTIQQFFQQRRSLVIVDNLEHIPAAGLWLAQVFQAIPQQQVIATSRVRLNVPHEQIYEVAVLPYPAAHASSEQLHQSPAVQLCLDRMEAVRLVDRSNSQLLTHVGQICRQVAGLPLAIELVAARTAEYRLETIVAAITNDLEFVGDGPLDLDLRQQTMAATISWSYQLLPAQSRQIMLQLAVFQAGWDIAAAAAVCGLDPELMEDHLTLLIDNHLLSYRLDSDLHPYAMLEPIRQYAWQLSPTDELNQLRLRHCDYYIAWVEPSEVNMLGPDAAFWHRSMEQSYPNIQFALHTAKAEANPRRFWQLLGFLYRLWWNAQLIAEAQAWLQPTIPALLQTTSEPYFQCRVLYTILLFCTKDTASYSRLAAYQYLVKLTQQHRFYALEAKTKNFYALVLTEQNKLVEASDLLLDATNLYRRIGDNNNMLTPMLNYANLLYKTKKFEQASDIYQELIIEFEKIQDYDGMYSSVKNLAVIYICQKKYYEAESKLLYLIEKGEDREHINIYLGDFDVYLRFIKIYFSLKREKDIDFYVKKLYPVSMGNLFFIEQVFTLCESIIYAAIIKEYYLVADTVYQYLLNIIYLENYEMRWYEAEFLAQTRIILNQQCNDFEFTIDDDFCLDYNNFNATMNYCLRIIYGFQ